MNTNHDFQIGKDHTVCEDFALSGVLHDSTPYAIVCDGCSASPDTDLGARLVAYAARENANRMKLLPYHSFGLNVIQQAKEATRPFPHLHPQTLDATLLIATVFEGVAKIYVYGDGAVYFRNKRGVTITHIEFETHTPEGIKTAPDYLSYHLDSARLANYLKYNTSKISTCDGSEVHMDPFSPVAFKYEVEPGDVICLSSDGIDSFRDPIGEVISWEDIAREFFEFKTREGVFVNRRISAFKRKCLKDGVSHLDDISIAAIVV